MHPPGWFVTGADTRPRNLMGQLDGTGNPRPADAGFDGRIFATRVQRAVRRAARLPAGRYLGQDLMESLS